MGSLLNEACFSLYQKIRNKNLCEVEPARSSSVMQKEGLVFVENGCLDWF